MSWFTNAQMAQSLEEFHDAHTVLEEGNLHFDILDPNLITKKELTIVQGTEMILISKIVTNPSKRVK